MNLSYSPKAFNQLTHNEHSKMTHLLAGTAGNEAIAAQAKPGF